ncbi:hypothetical protein LguiA_031452 [Lonicera macranthoides]
MEESDLGKKKNINGLTDLVFSWSLEDIFNENLYFNQPYKTLPGDVIIFADSKPETVSDLERAGTTWAFATVINIPDDENGDGSTSTHFKVKATKDVEARDGIQTSQFVVFLMNITTNKRIWNAIHMRGNVSIIKEVLCTDFLVEENCNLCSLDSRNGSVDETTLANLNKSQTEAILASLHRLKVNLDIEDIYLEYRVQRLVECLGPLTGWKYCLTSMINLLEDIVSQYQIFVENEMIKAKELSNEDEVDVKKLEFDSFLEFFRARFKSTASSIRQCIFTFCTHLPKSYIQESNYQNMVILIDLLDSFEEMLFKDNTVSEELEEIFSRKETDSYESFVGASASLVYIRSKSLSVLRTLRHSLEGIKLPSVLNKRSMMDFCFERASLIFCTVSSSYKLHSVGMEPLNLLLIDEAAQLKECESTIPIQLLGMKHAILIGDECQLPAMVASNVCVEAGFGRSLFERLSLLGHSKQLLNIQYRMHPSISSFPNSRFYQNQILDASNVKRKRQFLPSPMFGPYSFINVVGGRDELDDVEYSRRNMVEVAVAIKIVQNLYKGSIWFLNELQKENSYNGQIPRVQWSVHALWILGNEKTLAKSESVWEEVVHDAKNRCCFFNADEDDNMAKAILDMKKELDQLDDLLKGDSTLFRNAVWKVLFSDNFRKSFGKLRSSRTKKSVISLLVKLCSGWRPKNRSVDMLCEGSKQTLKQFKVEGLYIVCTIDIVKDTKYIQVLKVWDLLPLEEIPKLAKRLDSIFSMYTDDFINCCKVKFQDGNNLEIPNSWPTSRDIVRYKKPCKNEIGSESSGNTVDGRSYAENSKVSESLLNMKFYALSSGVVNHLLSDRDGRELELPFEVTDEEMEIIIFPKSSFILGRSGTGKTTVLTMKLFKKEQCQHIASEGFYAAESGTSMDANQKNEIVECSGSKVQDVLRQLFVTVSPKLCYAVKQQVSQLKRPPLPATTDDLSGALVSFASGGDYSAENIDTDDIDFTSEFEDIPDSFIDITPEKYPLVITFFKFLMMLDGTVGNSYFERFGDTLEISNGISRSSRSVALQTFLRTKEVNYDRFCSSYWPHFNEQITKKLDPSRVFTEIISHIKGGLRAGATHDGKLGREDYYSFSEGRMSTLNRQKRERIYNIYQDYEKMKVSNGEFDLSDLVIDLNHRLKSERYEGDMMDFVYIDEVQDLTMGQISLFKYICRNYDEGFVFAGDTAQTIARGIDFRFEDIRTLFYNDFLMGSRSDGPPRRKEKGLVAEISKLKQNFRTHDGVLKLAHSVIELLYRFFRDTIDILEAETSLICGELPLLLEPGNDQDAIATIFGNRGSVGGKIVGFGAEQVILVRDDCARVEVSNYVGKQALVLTIVECKGLEFQDVLLFNFFGSSPLKSQWRVVYEFMKEQELLDDSCPKSFPSFNEARHNILCSELKQLYVAITRTRQRLWICEDTEEFSKPIFDYWRRKGIVQVKKLDNSLAQAMQVASSPEEWKARGIKLFRENNYEMATMCFERAGDTTWELRGKAFGHKASADRLRGVNPEKASTFLREAAQIFESISKFESAAECFCDLGEYEKAGNIYLHKCVQCELKAAECFTMAGCHDRAADVFAKGNYYSECLSACTKGKLFDMGLQYIEDWKQHAPGDNDLVIRSKEIDKIEQEFLESCALSNYDLKDNNSMMKFVRAFHSMDLRRSFLKSLKCLDELLLLEEESGNFVEAAEIAKLRGDLLLEANFLEKAGRFKDASLLILWYVFFNSLWAPGSRGWPLKHFKQKEKFLASAMAFAKNDSDFLYELVCNEVNVFSHDRSNLSELKKYLKTSQRHKSLRGEISSVRKILDVILQFNASKYEWVDELSMDLTKHSEERISQNRISVQALVYFWNQWKESILSIFEYIGCIETQENYLELSTQYWKNVFPLDWRKSLTASLISLRGTDTSQKLLEEVILENISIKGGVTYGQIGRVVMTWLGSGKPTELCEKILKRFEEYPPWRAFIENLGGKAKEDDSSQNCDSVVHKFFKALEDTYNANWRVADYMPPSCFLYLLEHLLIAVYQSKGFFYTTKSSFVEWLFYQHSNANSSTSLTAGAQFPAGMIFIFVINIVRQLLYNKFETPGWIKESGINVKSYYPLLVLKLFVMLCVLSLNSSKYSEVIFELLGRGDITYMLPRGFYEDLRRNRKHNRININPYMLSEAFKRIGDPLVIVSLGKNCPKFACPNAIFVDMEANKSREEVISFLFPRSIGSPQRQNVAVNVDPNNSCGRTVPPKGDDGGKSSTVLSSSSASNADKDMNTMKRTDSNLKMNWEILWEISAALEQEDGKREGMLAVFFSIAKVEVEKNVNFLNFTVDKHCKKELSDGEDGYILHEANDMLIELEQLSTALGVSGKKLESDVSSIRELANKLKLRRPKMETFLNQFLLKSTKTAETRGEKNRDADEVEAKKAAVASESEAQSSVNIKDKTEGNKGKKGNGKSKKGKKGKGGKKK